MKKIILGIAAVFIYGSVISCGGNSSVKSKDAQQEQALIHDVGVDEFKTLIKENSGIVLDVRTPGEVAEGIIEGAIVIDITQGDFMDKISNLEKGKPIYVYCKAGGRSANASEKLVGLGYTQVYNLMGGMDAWKTSGNAIVK